MAQIEHELVYVEVKSSPPKHIDQRDVASFFERIADVVPHAAVFFVDTELRMTDKIASLFAAELRVRYGRASRRKYPVARLRDELFHINHQVFIVNSTRNLAANFRDCFRDYWRSLIRVHAAPRATPEWLSSGSRRGCPGERGSPPVFHPAPPARG